MVGHTKLRGKPNEKRKTIELNNTRIKTAHIKGALFEVQGLEELQRRPSAAVVDG